LYIQLYNAFLKKRKYFLDLPGALPREDRWRSPPARRAIGGYEVNLREALALGWVCFSLIAMYLPNDPIAFFLWALRIDQDLSMSKVE